jgi:hypothetical protein
MRGNASTVFDSNTAIANSIDNALDEIKKPGFKGAALIGNYRIRLVTSDNGINADIIVDDVKKEASYRTFSTVPEARKHLRRLVGLDQSPVNDTTPGEEAAPVAPTASY